MSCSKLLITNIVHQNFFQGKQFKGRKRKADEKLEWSGIEALDVSFLTTKVGVGVFLRMSKFLYKCLQKL